MNIASVSWGDHLSFGDGDGRLATPEALARRMAVWREELGAGLCHWRVMRSRIPGRFSAARGYRHPSLTAARGIGWDDFHAVPRLAAEAGIHAWLYVSLFDEGWPLAPPQQRAVSHHNAMHGQHVAWQSDLTRRHPDWIVVDRSGRRRQWGVVSLAYPEARRAFIDRWTTWLGASAFEGLFVCLRSQSRPADHGDQFGFTPPAVEAYRRQHGVDPRSPARDPDVWRRQLGADLTQFVRELRVALDGLGRRVRLGIGMARGDVLGPPLGNTVLDWRAWVSESLVDQLVIDQHSSQCPSMWHRLWPMHRGSGYVQDDTDPTSLPPLLAHVGDTYAPAIRGTGTRLFVARQWHVRSPGEERALLEIPGASGLVFSTFRHDNPGQVARGDWRAGALGR